MDDKAKVSQAGAQAASGSRRSNGTQVVARFRPLAATGLEAKSKPCVENLDATRVTFCADNERDNSSFTFDRVFGPDSTQVRTLSLPLSVALCTTELLAIADARTPDLPRLRSSAHVIFFLAVSFSPTSSTSARRRLSERYSGSMARSSKQSITLRSPAATQPPPLKSCLTCSPRYTSTQARSSPTARPLPERRTPWGRRARSRPIQQHMDLFLASAATSLSSSPPLAGPRPSRSSSLLSRCTKSGSGAKARPLSSSLKYKVF